MAETMTALVERNRAFKEAYAAADFDAGPSEDEMLASADAEAGRTIETDPPRLRDKTDLEAAIRYVAEDVDFLQEGHARVLARALEYLTTSAVDPLSVHAATLFGAYMDTEREQERLAASGDSDGVNALGEQAMAIYEAVFAIRDRSGCSNLIGARILLDLVMRHYWHGPDGPVFDAEDRAVALPMLEILADRLTGEVRRQAAFALGTIGVVIDAEPNDVADRRTKPTITTTSRRQRHVAYRNGRNRKVPDFYRALAQVMEA